MRGFNITEISGTFGKAHADPVIFVLKEFVSYLGACHITTGREFADFSYEISTVIMTDGCLHCLNRVQSPSHITSHRFAYTERRQTRKHSAIRSNAQRCFFMVSCSYYFLFVHQNI